MNSEINLWMVTYPNGEMIACHGKACEKTVQEIGGAHNNYQP